MMRQASNFESRQRALSGTPGAENLAKCRSGHFCGSPERQHQLIRPSQEQARNIRVSPKVGVPRQTFPYHNKALMNFPGTSKARAASRDIKCSDFLPRIWIKMKQDQKNTPSIPDIFHEILSTISLYPKVSLSF